MPQDNTGSFYIPLPRPEKKPDNTGNETLGTITRTGAGMIAPIATRIGSGVASGFANKIPLVGTAAAGLIGGGGEILAQMLENQGTDKSINWPRVAIESGLSMIPIGSELRIGKYVKDLSSASRGAAALKGAALAGAGVVGRKATDEDPNTSALKPSSYGLGDAVQVAIGAGIGSRFGKSAPKARPMGPQTPSDYLDELKLRKAEDINTEASRLEALGDAGSKEKANTIRVTAANAKRGNEKTYDAISNARETAAQQEAKNLGSAAGKAPALPTIEEAIAQGPKAVEEFALRAEALGNIEYAEQLRKAAVAKGVSSGTTSRAVIRGTNAAKKAELEAKRRASKRAATPKTPATPKVPEAPFNPPRMVEEPAVVPITPEAPPATEAVKEVIKQKRVRAKAAQPKTPAVTPEVPVEIPPVVPEAPVAPIAEAPIPTPVNPSAPIEDIEERVLVKNPMSGRAEPAPGDISTPERTLILQPKEGGGWDRAEATAQGIKRSSTKAPKPGVKVDPEPLDLNKVREDLPNIKDPLVREMAERELGGVPTPDASVENPVPDLTPSRVEIPTSSAAAPQALIEEVQALKSKIDTAMANAASMQEREAIAEAFAPEVDALQLKLSLAERAADKGEGGFIDPMLAARIGLGVTGAATGAAYDKEDRLRGALLGGAAGAMAPSLLRHNPDDTGKKLSPLDWLSNYQRFSLLSGFPNVFINTAAPISGSAMASLEKIISGKLHSDPAMQEAGQAGLKSLIRPSSYSPSAISGYWKEAQRLIRDADEGRGDMIGGTPNWIARFLRSPANLMTTGDTAAREMLERGGGWTDDMAREATLTNEPRYAFTNAIANVPRTGGPLARFAFPFVKTAANAIEGSAERTPILGMFLRKATGDPNAEATIGELVTRQGLGAAVGYAAYQLGAHVNPEDGKQYYLPLLITNMGGQYGPLAAAAFAAGQASQSGDLREQLLAGSTHFFRDVPLPTMEAPANLVKAGANVIAGEPVNTQTDNPILQKIPSNLIPRGITQYVQQQEQNAPTSFYTPLPR